jgi:transcriptional regulator with GAF, ATPase, and Fis domain
MAGRHGGEGHDEHGVGLLGHGEQHRELLRGVERVGPMEATVLILGERGTGKELVARALHDANSRRTRTLVAINCAALSPGLLANELFGHERRRGGLPAANAFARRA